ncbi:hypothetical protein BD626DRAFT_500654 [Schizophyllum amplum]|uniref:Uncharacterized protein n=1 Tax=Schizophyllum amplum TaxID=97359 RepID=A0A550CAJ7_9AGAR|nr:hypothetical protein BD626DRAFT_500654 [Auriculariopsis ampla]
MEGAVISRAGLARTRGVIQREMTTRLTARLKRLIDSQRRGRARLRNTPSSGMSNRLNQMHTNLVEGE